MIGKIEVNWIGQGILINNAQILGNDTRKLAWKFAHGYKMKIKASFKRKLAFKVCTKLKFGSDHGASDL